MKKIFISGSRASGKTSLLRLLDGNPNIGVIHHHDKIFHIINLIKSLNSEFIDAKKLVDNYDDLITNEKKGTLIKFKKKKFDFKLTPLLLRKLLIKTGYFEIEQESWYKKSRLGFDSSKLKNIKFNFNFKKFDNLFFKKIFTKKKLNIENFLNLLFETYFQILNKKKFKYVCYLLPNNVLSIKNIIDENFNCKIIYMDRDLKGIITAQALRNIYDKKLLVQKFNRNILTNNYITPLLFSKRIKFFIKEKVDINDIQKNYPNKVMIINFHDLILKKDREIKKIFKWLNIKIYKSNFFSSVNKKKIEEKFGVINDNIYINEFNSKIIEFLMGRKISFNHLFSYYFLRYYWAFKKIL